MVLFCRKAEDDYNIMLNLFNNKMIEAETFTSPDTILNVFLNIFKNVDWDLVCNIEELQNTGILEQKTRTYYNYILCREEDLTKLRNLGEKSLLLESDTLANFEIFKKSIFYFGKAKGRRDLMHLKDTIQAIISWQDKIVKAGGKIYTCMRALLESSGVVIVTGFLQ